MTASDATVATYADNYFEYDGDQRVTLEQVRGGSQTYGLDYGTPNTALTPNEWANSTVLTNPDATTVTVYTNSLG